MPGRRLLRRWICLFSLIAGCEPAEYDYHRHERVDVFRQTRQRAVDLLLVIDNSCSMEGEQDHLARSFEALIDALEAGDTDWRVAATTSEPGMMEYRGQLSGGTDEIVVVGATGGRIDRIAYNDATWPLERGVALERCDLGLSGDNPLGWEIAEGGSPGSPNRCTTPRTSGPDRGPRSPERGELLVSEFLPWSLGDDTRCEWIELANATSDTLDLTGVTIEDEGRNSASLPDGTRIAPGGRLVAGRSLDPAENCGTPVDLVLEGSFSLAQGERWIDRETPNAEEVFSELVAVGTGAFGLEMGMENALLALSDPENQENTGGFLRASADLALLFFSDEDDLSPGSIDDYIDAFRLLKGDTGYREPGRVRFGAAVGTDLPGEVGGSCEQEEAIHAERYLELMARTGGVAWSICDDLSQVADQAGVTFSEQRQSFALSAVPALETLAVEEYASEDQGSDLGPMIRDLDFWLEEGDEEQVWMVFPEDRVPPGGVVVVTYEALPDATSVDLDRP